MEAIKDQLYRSFRLYVEYATPYLQEGLPWLPKEAADKKIVPLLSPSLSWFRTTIEKIEESREFDALVLNFSFALGRNPNKINGVYQIDCERNANRNFFRRSKLYLRISKNIKLLVS